MIRKRMSTNVFQILLFFVVVGIMISTCLSLYLSSSSRKIVQGFGIGHAKPSSMRLRKGFSVLKNAKSDIRASTLDFRLVIHGNT
jgi:hypothetical protein